MHLQSNQTLASGVHAVQETTSLAAVQAAYRFFNNPRVSLAALMQPLIETAREEVPRECDEYVLGVHDWSQLMFKDHTSKPDRIMLSSRRVPEGYELQSSLLVSDRDGSPLAPVGLSLRAADGVHCSRVTYVRHPQSPLDELAPTMRYLEAQRFGRPLVNLIDAEADSVGHFREWSEQGWLFLVRADDRIARHDGQERHFSAIRRKLQRQKRFQQVREVKYHGRRAWQWVAETQITLTRPAYRNRPKSEGRRCIPGPPLTLRLVLADVRDLKGRLLAKWYLLTNVTAVPAERIALWYYWRWRIEKYFKLLKSAGMHIEEWQQTSASAIAKRLLVASTACVMTWRLARSTHPRAEEARRFLVRMSGRQMKRGTTFTIPALLAGTWVLLGMLEALEHYSIEDLREFAAILLGSAAQPP